MAFYKQTVGFRHLYKLYKVLTSNRYTIGIADFDERVIEMGYVPQVNWIKDNYKLGWFADPFILRVTEDEFVLLVEEYVYKLGRGIISQVKIDRNDYSIKNITPIINTGYHLSFPSYYRKNGKVYIFPEQGARGATWLYEYDEETCTAKELRVINPNESVDTTIMEMPDGKRMLTCTIGPDYNGSSLYLYPFYEENCPQTLKPFMMVDSPNKTGRNAGGLFMIEGKLYRPAQYCKNDYGEATEIQEVEFDDDKISLKGVNIIYSPNKEYPDAFHTFNVFDNRWVVVDGRRKRFPLMAKLLRLKR